MTGLKHQAAAARKWRSAARQVRRHFPAHLPPLLFLTDPTRTPDPVSVARTLPACAGVIYRHFGAADRHNVAARLADVCSDRGMCFLVAADPELALSAGADGVHWPEARLSESLQHLGKFALQTGSAHSPRAILAACKASLDAALVSTVFPSNSPSASSPLGPTRFRSWTKAASMPVYALGGVNAANAGSVADSAGIAAIEGFV